ncbi:MAG: Lrp/AsnC ligand binding domain-containing protein [Actinomycetota bacterium]
MDAFVYVRARPGKTEDVVTQLQAMRGVHHAMIVVGDWDVLAAVHGTDLADITAGVLRSVQRIEGVARTMTTPVVPADVMGLAGGGLGATAPMRRVGDACFVRIRTVPETTTHVFEALAGMDHVAGVALVAGEEDILAEIPYGWDETARVVLERIQGIQGVRSTSTLIGVPYLAPEEEDRDQFSAWT